MARMKQTLSKGKSSKPRQVLQASLPARKSTHGAPPAEEKQAAVDRSIARSAARRAARHQSGKESVSSSGIDGAGGDAFLGAIGVVIGRSSRLCICGAVGGDRIKSGTSQYLIIVRQ